LLFSDETLGEATKSETNLGRLISTEQAYDYNTCIQKNTLWQWHCKL